MNRESEMLQRLRRYFQGRNDLGMAFLFGSYAKGTQCCESDVDIAIYLETLRRELAWEQAGSSPDENKIWNDVEDIVGRNVDLLVLNRAPSSIVFEVLRTGIPIIIKNRLRFLDLLTRASYEAIDFASAVKEYVAVMNRSASLSEADRVRLIRYVEFLRNELSDLASFANLQRKTYETDSHVRRDAERCVENIANCSLDIAKILLASERQMIPDTYAAMLRGLSNLHGFDEQLSEQLAEYARLRNILAHEYLDMRFRRMSAFIEHAEPLYRALADFVQDYLASDET